MQIHAMHVLIDGSGATIGLVVPAGVVIMVAAGAVMRMGMRRVTMPMPVAALSSCMRMPMVVVVGVVVACLM